MPFSKKYEEYINSPMWRARRERALQLAGHRCQYETVDAASASVLRCQALRMLSVHHRTYERLGNEADDDLEVLCWKHHQLEHLMQLKCGTCDGTLFTDDAAGILWLESELRSLGVDLERERWTWTTLPSKNDLVVAVTALLRSCSNCLIWKGQQHADDDLGRRIRETPTRSEGQTLPHPVPRRRDAY